MGSLHGGRVLFRAVIPGMAPGDGPGRLPTMPGRERGVTGGRSAGMKSAAVTAGRGMGLSGPNTPAGRKLSPSRLCGDNADVFWNDREIHKNYKQKTKLDSMHNSQWPVLVISTILQAVNKFWLSSIRKIQLPTRRNFILFYQLAPIYKQTTLFPFTAWWTKLYALQNGCLKKY